MSWFGRRNSDKLHPDPHRCPNPCLHSHINLLIAVLERFMSSQTVSQADLQKAIADLTQQVSANQDENAKVQQAIKDEIVRVENTITALQGQVGSGGLDPVVSAQMLQDLQTAKTNLQGIVTAQQETEATLAAEDPTPAPTA